MPCNNNFFGITENMSTKLLYPAKACNTKERWFCTLLCRIYKTYEIYKISFPHFVDYLAMSRVVWRFALPRKQILRDLDTLQIKHNLAEGNGIPAIALNN